MTEKEHESKLGHPIWKEEGQVGHHRYLQISAGLMWKKRKPRSESWAKEGHR